MAYCKVGNCRYAATHTTVAHKCGKCGGTVTAKSSAVIWPRLSISVFILGRRLRRAIDAWWRGARTTPRIRARARVRLLRLS